MIRSRLGRQCFELNVSTPGSGKFFRYAALPDVAMNQAVWKSTSSGGIVARFLYLGGAVLTSTLLLLGFVWPSIFTLIALLALPSPILFLFGVAKPQFVDSRPLLRKYLIGCAAASVLSWAAEIIWLWSQGVEFVS